MPDFRKDLKVVELKKKNLSYSQIAKALKMHRSMVIYRWNRVVRSYPHLMVA
jgi:intein-encoded DNA endonuclease-like protein